MTATIGSSSPGPTSVPRQDAVAISDDKMAVILEDTALVKRLVTEALSERVCSSARHLVDTAYHSTVSMRGKPFSYEINNLAADHNWLFTHVPYTAFYDYLEVVVARLLRWRNQREHAGLRLPEGYEVTASRRSDSGYHYLDFVLTRQAERSAPQMEGIRS